MSFLHPAGELVKLGRNHGTDRPSVDHPGAAVAGMYQVHGHLHQVGFVGSLAMHGQWQEQPAHQASHPYIPDQLSARLLFASANLLSSVDLAMPGLSP